MSRQIELRAIQIANLRGFRDAVLPLKDGLTVLVGPNNSGKTSILRLLDWALNWGDEATLVGDEPLSPEELRLLMPARETRNAARRLILHVSVLDGRRWRRFQCVDGVAALRLSLTLPGVLRLNLGPPRRNESTDRLAALDLLRELRDAVAFSLVPASRDAKSASFERVFRDAVLSKLLGRATHSGRAGAPGEYRRVKRALEEILSVADGLVLPLWDEVKRGLPPGMAVSATVGADLDPADLVEWIAGNTALRVATGAHDSRTVEPEELGSGLQSLLELALQQAKIASSEVDRIIAVEEPEAFLHPAAQRTLARMVAERGDGRRIVSTHSPILVDEARFGETILVRDHRFFAPADVDDKVRDAINTSLLVGYGAEMAFSRSVLLVEGEGDRAFYETLRRRIARSASDGRLDHITVVPVGSKTSFAPWLRLLSSYGTEGDRPIRWLLVADADAATDVRRAHQDAGLRLPMAVRAALMSTASERGNSDRRVYIAATDEVNRNAARRRTALHLSPIDLEHSIVQGCSDEYASGIGAKLGLAATSKDRLESALRAEKKPHLRAAFAEEIEWAALSDDTRVILRRWLEPVMTRSQAASLLRRTT